MDDGPQNMNTREKSQQEDALKNPCGLRHFHPVRHTNWRVRSFTPSRFLFVNNVKVSSYVAFQKSEFLKIGDVKTPLTYHWLAHTFQAPHRLWCSITSCLKETYTDAGVSTWVDLSLHFTNWWLDQNAFIMVLVLVPLALSLVAMSCLDFFITTYPFTTAIGLLGLWFLRKPAAMVAS